MTSAARLITTSGGISSEGQNNHTDIIESNNLNTNVVITPELPDKITIKYYGTIPHLVITKEHQFKNVADILELSKKHLWSILSAMLPDVNGLYSFTTPLFGLIDERHQFWLVSTDTLTTKSLTTKSPTYYYRFQFCLPPDSKSYRHLFHLDKFLLLYCFTQCRDDFINNRITSLYTDERQDEMLGYVMNDYLIPKSSYDYRHVSNQAAELPTSNYNPLHSYKFLYIWKHVPKKCRKKFYFPSSYINLYLTLRSELGSKGEIDRKDVPSKQRDFMQGIFKEASEHCADSYNGIPYNEEKLMNIKIYPYKELSGVYYNGNHVFTITDILDIEHEMECSINGMKLRVIIILSTKCPEEIKFDYTDGLSFVYKLLGYYRIMINYHMYLRKDLDSGTSGQSLPQVLHSFGPMMRPDAYKILQKRLDDFKRTNMGITSVYLIVQDIYADKFEIISCNSCGEERFYPLNIENGYYSVIKSDESKTYEKIDDLRTTFGRQIKPDGDNGDVFLKKIFSPEKGHTRKGEITCKIESDPQLFSPDQINIDDDTEKDGDLCVDILKVRLAANGETVMSMIQLKSSIPLPKLPTTDDLIELSDTLHKIKSSAFVRFYGVSVSVPYRVFVDHSPHGSLLAIIKNKFRNPAEVSDSQTDKLEMEVITLLQFVTTATAVCQGLDYLSQNNLHHGNIKCSNIYVYGLTNVQFDVKIGQPGLIKFYNKQPLADPINAERIPWIGAECFDDLSRCSMESEIYSFSTFVWEFLSYGKNPIDELISLNLKNPKERMAYFKNDGKLKKPPTLEHNELEFPFKQEIKDQMWTLMLECWSVKPENRPNIMDIIKRLRNMYSQYGSVTEEEINIEGLKQINQPKKNFCQIIHLKQLKIGSKLGSGHYGVVKRADYFPSLTNKKDFRAVALKLMHDSSTDTPDKRERKKKLFEEEIKTMQKAQHENVIGIIGVCYTGESQLVVMEFVKNGDLANWLKEHKKEELDDPYYKIYRKFVKEIAEGMKYLSSIKIIHRDIAARNILVTESEHIKITDFGLAKRLEDRHYYRIKTRGSLPMLWTAPECYGENPKLTSAADVWSFGVVLWEIYNEGANPHLQPKSEGLNQHVQRLLKGETLPIFPIWPNFIQSLMKKCWDLNPENRPSFAEIVQELNETDI